jgi:hypothetical protein
MSDANTTKSPSRRSRKQRYMEDGWIVTEDIPPSNRPTWQEILQRLRERKAATERRGARKCTST